MAKVTAVEQAQRIVDLSEEVEYIDDKLKHYKDKSKPTGSRWDIEEMGDSRHFDMRYMLTKLPEEEITAINRYIINKFKKHVREGKKKLSEMGIK